MRGAHEQEPLQREQEKRGANRNSGRGKGWAKAEATKPTPKIAADLLRGRVRAARFRAACVSRDKWVQVVECCSIGRGGSSAAYAVAVQPKIQRNDLNRHKSSFCSDSKKKVVTPIYYIKEILQNAFLLSTEIDVVFFFIFRPSNSVLNEYFLGVRNRLGGPSSRGPILGFMPF